MRGPVRLRRLAAGAFRELSYHAGCCPEMRWRVRAVPRRTERCRWWCWRSSPILTWSAGSSATSGRPPWPRPSRPRTAMTDAPSDRPGISHRAGGAKCAPDPPAPGEPAESRQPRSSERTAGLERPSGDLPECLTPRHDPALIVRGCRMSGGRGWIPPLEGRLHRARRADVERDNPGPTLVATPTWFSSRTTWAPGPPASTTGETPARENSPHDRRRETGRRRQARSSFAGSGPHKRQSWLDASWRKRTAGRRQRWDADRRDPHSRRGAGR